MAKLVLDIEPEVIEVINNVAKKKHLSVSKVAEELFKSLINIEKPSNIKPESELSDWVKRLVASPNPNPDFDHKVEYGKHLEQKYGS
jgi:hypothetical protein